MQETDRNGTPSPEFSRSVRFSDIGPSRKTLKLAAGRAELAALARRFDLADITLLEASLTLQQSDPGIVIVHGGFFAEFLVDGLSPPENAIFTVSELIEEIFATAEGCEALLAGSDNEDADAELAGDEIDLGELVAQHLALALDPVLFEAGQLETGARISALAPDSDATSESPFSILASVRWTRDRGNRL